jgi:uncharacterized alpha/beta hydrolase family protein
MREFFVGIIIALICIIILFSLIERFWVLHQYEQTPDWVRDDVFKPEIWVWGEEE